MSYNPGFQWELIQLYVAYRNVGMESIQYCFSVTVKMGSEVALVCMS